MEPLHINWQTIGMFALSGLAAVLWYQIRSLINDVGKLRQCVHLLEARVERDFVPSTDLERIERKLDAIQVSLAQAREDLRGKVDRGDCWALHSTRNNNHTP